jgi:hypothetical protein
MKGLVDDGILTIPKKDKKEWDETMREAGLS